MAHPFDGIAEKLKRADEHILRLASEIDRFINEEPNAIVVDYDPQQAESFIRFHQGRTVPRRISVITGEVLYQLRSSLDHAVCVFVKRAGGTPTITTQYPIWLYKPTKPRHVRRYQGETSPIDPSGPVGTLIEKTQPYHRGKRGEDYALGILKALSNADKHRALTLHVVMIRPEFRLTFQGDDWTQDAVFDDPDMGTVPPGPVDKAITGFEIVNVQRQLTTDVAFDRFGTLKDQGVVNSLKWLRGFVGGLLQVFGRTIT